MPRPRRDRVRPAAPPELEVEREWPAAQVRALRLWLGLSQAGLAAALGFAGDRVVRRWEAGAAAGGESRRAPGWEARRKMLDLAARHRRHRARQAAPAPE